MTGQEHIAEYIKISLQMRGDRNPEGWAYRGPDDFVLRHGREFRHERCPDDVAMGEAKNCYGNAFNLAIEREDLTYVEGYGLRIIPCQHAWCVTDEGVVVDPTWDAREDRDWPQAYFGVPFKWKFVNRTILDNEYYGVLWPGDMANLPLMRGEYGEEEWLA